MTPILFESNEKAFTSNGIGRLSDAVKCEVTEKRNGEYTLLMEYPISGIHFEDISIEKIILAIPSDGKDAEPFRIYSISKPLSGKVTIEANHISYDLRRITITPFTENGLEATFLHLESVVPGWEFRTNGKSGAGTFKVNVPKTVRSVLGGEQGSVLDVYGKGEYEFTKNRVTLHLNRGMDSGVTIRYGKNLSDVKTDVDSQDIYNAVIPYWSKEDVTVTGHQIVGYTFESVICVPMDLSSKFETQPSVEQLDAMATTLLASNTPWMPSTNVQVSFVALWQTEEYKDFACLERVNLCDQVTVRYDELGVDVKTKVISTKYDVLLERYISIELGDVKKSLADSIAPSIIASTEFKDSVQEQTSSAMGTAIANATDKITGSLGGHVVIVRNADGEPTELCILEDSDDIATATKIWRWNANGLGYSKTGYNGQYALAMTADGQIVADFITTGNLSASRIKGGLLALGGKDNANGTLYVYDEDGHEAVTITKDGIRTPHDMTFWNANVYGNLIWKQMGQIDTSSGAISCGQLTVNNNGESGVTGGIFASGNGSFGGKISTAGDIHLGGNIVFDAEGSINTAGGGINTEGGNIQCGSIDGNLKYKHTNEVNFSGGKQSRVFFNYRNADSDAEEGIEQIEYRFCNYSHDVTKSHLIGGQGDFQSVTTGSVSSSGGLSVGGNATIGGNLITSGTIKGKNFKEFGWTYKIKITIDGTTGQIVHLFTSAGYIIIGSWGGNAHVTRSYMLSGSWTYSESGKSVTLNSTEHVYGVVISNGGFEMELTDTNTPQANTLTPTSENRATNDSNGNKLGGMVSSQGYWGFRDPDGYASWIRTTTNGLLPVESGGITNGHSSLGSQYWYFSTAYIDYVRAYSFEYGVTGKKITVSNNKWVLDAGYGIATGWYDYAPSTSFSNVIQAILINSTYVYAIFGHDTGCSLYSYRGGKAYSIANGGSAVIDGITFTYNNHTVGLAYSSGQPWAILRANPT